MEQRVFLVQKKLIEETTVKADSLFENKNGLIIKYVYSFTFKKMQFCPLKQRHLLLIDFSGMINYDTFSVVPSIINEDNI